MEHINTQDQVQILSTYTNASLWYHQVDAANTLNKLESETRPGEGNKSLNSWWLTHAITHLRLIK